MYWMATPDPPVSLLVWRSTCLPETSIFRSSSVRRTASGADEMGVMMPVCPCGLSAEAAWAWVQIVRVIEMTAKKAESWLNMAHLKENVCRYPSIRKNQVWVWERHTSAVLLGLAAMMWVGCGAETNQQTDLDVDICTGEVETEWSAGVLHLQSENCASFALSARILGDGPMTVDFIEIEGGWQPQITATSDAVLRGLVLEGPHQQMGQDAAVFWR